MTRSATRKLTTSFRAIFAAAVVLPLLGQVAVCRAEDQKTEDVEFQPDLSTARSAALAWIDASWSGDARSVHKILVDDERQRKFIEGMLRFSAAVRALESAAIEQFGEAGGQVSGYPDGSAKAVEKTLEVNEKGDRAIASVGNAMLALQLRRIDGEWRVDLSESARDPRARRAVEVSVAAARVAEKIAAEVAEGKFQTAEEAKAAFREQRLAVIKK